MADDNTQLPAGEETPQLEESKTEQLESGDDLAAAALEAATPDTMLESEVEASDQVAETVFSLQNIIERNANKLDEVKDEIKKQREQLKSVFENDTQLASAEEQQKQFSSQVKERKSQLQNDPTVQRLKVAIGELKEKQKEIEEALSNHLVNYFSLTNSKSFDTSDGDQREFDIKARVKRSRK